MKKVSFCINRVDICYINVQNETGSQPRLRDAS